MLQVGGVQDAVIVAEPAWGVLTVQVVPAAHPVAPPPALSAAGSEETQVRGGLGTMQPCTSTAVAVMISEGSLFSTKMVALLICETFTPSSRAMHCTGEGSVFVGWVK